MGTVGRARGLITSCPKKSAGITLDGGVDLYRFAGLVSDLPEEVVTVKPTGLDPAGPVALI
jgi:hypothetical protein